MNIKKYLIILVLAATVMVAGALYALDDPSSGFLGAASMGMGRTGLTYISPNVQAIFNNIALLAESRTWQVTTTQAKLFGDIDVFQIGGSLPMFGGTLGMSVVQLSSGGLPYVLGYDLITGNPQLATVDFYNRVIKPTYSQKVDIKYLGEVDLGIALKIFQQGISSYSDSGSGMDLDIGAAGKTAFGLRWGLLAKNVLPASMGGKNTWNTSNGVREEDIPNSLQIGVGGTALNDKLNWEVVLENWLLTNNGRPLLWHVGGEYDVMKNLKLRVGINQEPVPNPSGGGSTVLNDLTAGLGYMLGDYSFDYAYHAYSDLSENTSHFFSLSYTNPVGKGRLVNLPVLTLKPPVGYSQISSPLSLEGSCSTLSTEVFVNDAYVPRSYGKFASTIYIKTNPTLARIVLASPVTGSLAVTKKLILNRTFTDVTADYWAWADGAISSMSEAGIIGGYNDLTFRPEKDITRAEFVTMLGRKIDAGEQIKEATKFVDVPESFWAYKNIIKITSIGLAGGYKDGTFRPTKPITRAEFLKILTGARKLNLPGSGASTIESYTHFTDIGRHWAKPYIVAAENSMWLGYLKSTDKFEPDKNISRAEAAEILFRSGIGKPTNPYTIVEGRFKNPSMTVTIGLFDKETAHLDKEEYSMSIVEDKVIVKIPRFAEDPDIRMQSAKNLEWIKDPTVIRLVQVDKQTAIYQISGVVKAENDKGRLLAGAISVSILLLGLAAFDRALKLYNAIKAVRKQR